jgi:hypothetical protein
MALHYLHHITVQLGPGIAKDFDGVVFAGEFDFRGFLLGHIYKPVGEARIIACRWGLIEK